MNQLSASHPHTMSFAALSLIVLFHLALPSVRAITAWEELLRDEQLKMFLSTLEPYANQENDVVFVLDESGSIGSDVFPQVINFTELIARQLTVSRDYSQLAVITYGSYVRFHITYVDNPAWENMCTFLRNLGKIDYGGGGTNTGAALQEAQKILNKGRSHANKIVVLISDGQSNEGPNVVDVSYYLRKSGIIIFSVGVASINEEELEAVVTSKNHFYALKNFKFIEELNDYLKNDSKDDIFDRVANASLCDSSCSTGKDCCDIHAHCYCGTKTGRYECSCNEGFGGASGYKGQCRTCPIGTYKDKTGNRICQSCPANSTTLKIGSKSIEDCRCIAGHVGKPETGRSCEPIECNQLKTPEGGTLIPKNCGHTYGSKCSFKCFANYCPFSCSRGISHNDIPAIDLTTNEPRTCLETGKWSGEDFFCEKIKCPALNYPEYGTHNCSSKETDFGVGTICHMTCKKGYVLSGSSYRTCLIDKSWTGEETFCEASRCPMLKTNEDLKVEPKVCGVREMPFQSTCVYYCKKDKKLVTKDAKIDNEVFNIRTCQVEGKWSNMNVGLYCKDTEPPQLTCPPSMKLRAEQGKATALVSWDLPSVKDNVDEGLQAYAVEPKHVKPPHSFPMNTTKVVYEAVDSSGNINTCSFLVTVIDDQPPNVDKCPYDIVVQHQDKSGTTVFWDEPEFSDNSGKVTVDSVNRKSGDHFRWGPPSTVTYQASDPSGNTANCTFQVIVKAYSCGFSEPPANGYLTCDMWTNGQLCSPTCREGYSFAQVTEPVYFCSQRTRKWGRVPGSIPKNKFIFPWGNCGEIQAPKSVDVNVEVEYHVTSCSDEDHTELKERFIKTLMSKHKLFCPVKKGCHVKNVDVVCKKQSVGGRRKRAAEASAYSLSSTSTSKSFTKRQSKDDSLLLFSFDIEVHNNASSNENTSCQNCVSNLQDIYEHGINVNDVLEPTVAETVQDVYNLDSTAKKKFKYNVVPVCKEGSVLENNTCVNCPIGTHFDITTSLCKVCPLKYYQDEEGSLSCKPCPEESTTLMTRSQRVEDCRRPCKPGTFSDTGLEPCLACPRGSYQDKWSSTFCLTCPDGMITLSSGTSFPSQCASPCEAGSFSDTGYSSCLLCPFGTYQPFTQQTGCFNCPMSTTTVVEGADNMEYCQTFHFCRDFKPCENGANCTDDGVEYKCMCVPGFTGKNCEININDCDSDACENNGTCVDGVNAYSCVCQPGYSGTRCEVDNDDCRSGPCRYGATCIDLVNDYDCACVKGFSGRNCEINIDDCALSPCLNGGKCFDMQNSYRCCCPPGYSGYNCSVEVNKCDHKPCFNGGTCIPSFNDFKCSCADGYEGVFCEINADDCPKLSCYNGGTCIDGINSASCICPLMYFGEQCETALPSEFSIKFMQPATYDYVLLPNPRHLFGITLSFFMRSTNSDPKQRGTPISYSYYNEKTGAVVDNGLTLYDTNKLILYIHGIAMHTKYTVNSKWHHYAVTWNSFDGSWSFNVDGNASLSGTGLATGEHLYPGVFVLGQEQDGLGDGFSIFESFVGEIAEFNIWDYSFAPEEIEMLSGSCGYTGNVISWPLILKHMHGDLNYSTDFNLCSSVGVCKPGECYCKSTPATISGVCEHMVQNCNSHPCANNLCSQNGNYSVCDCGTGYAGKLCEYDIDECLVNNGNCSHGCSNSNGSYQCTCPNNMVLADDGHTCKDPDFCYISNGVYYDGEKWSSSCEECTCSKGVVLCQEKACLNTTCGYNEDKVVLPGDCCSTCLSSTPCIVEPNNNIKTFDAMQYRFDGMCKYTLLEDCIDGTFDLTFEVTDSSAGKTVVLSVLCDVVAISANGMVTVNAEEVNLPFLNDVISIKIYGSHVADTEYTTFDGHNLRLEDSDSYNSRYSVLGNRTDHIIHILTTHGVVVEWSPLGKVTVRLPDRYFEKTCGLCGNFNGNMKDDMASKDHIPARMLSEFIESWKIDGDCKELVPTLNFPKLPMDTVVTFKQRVNMLMAENPWIILNCSHITEFYRTIAESACSQLWKGDFVNCHAYVNPNMYYFLCMKSSCLCKDYTFCFCDTLFYYIEECANWNVTLTSLGEAAICKNYCNGGMVYKECGPACPDKCGAKSPSDINCSNRWSCIPGCYCPEGTALHEGHCIPKNECLPIN